MADKKQEAAATAAKDAAWSIEVATPDYTDAQKAEIAKLERDLEAHMAQVKPHRYEHSLSVARTAEQMALAYGIDPFLARVAGTLHDWDKVIPNDEEIEHARALGIDLGVSLELVQPLLHGLTAARELPKLYPELPAEVFQAIARHTTGHAHMTPLDEVIFVADGIEPLRKGSIGIAETRALVDARAPLDEVYYQSFAGGIVYVIKTDRYLYPGTIDIYNDLVAQRDEARGK